MAKSYNIKTNLEEEANLLLEPYAAYLLNPTSKLRVIKSGLPSDSLQNLITLTGANRFDIAQMLSLTEPTLRKYINEGKNLNTGLSEHVLLLFELFDKGIDTLGSLNSFKSWLNHYNISLEAKPMDLLDTITGIGMVYHVLESIDHGVLA